MALTAFTNADGSVWGYRGLIAPAGARPDVTPAAAGSYSFNVQTVKTKEDWQSDVRQEINQDSGVSMENYKAVYAFSSGNRTDIKAIYAFYQKLFTNNPTEFYWAGLAKLAGAPVYAGLSDAWNGQNGALIGGSPILAYLAYDFQTTLVQMNIDIYSDLAWQFEAYRKGGLDALEEINAVDDTALDITSWRKIDQGIQENNQALILEGNQNLLQREQQQVLPPRYTQLNSIDTRLMTIFAKCPVWDPSTSLPYASRDFVSVMGSGHNIADTTDRWNWITTPTTGIWDTWVNLSSTDKTSQVSVPLTTRAVTYSLLPSILFKY